MINPDASALGLAAGVRSGAVSALEITRAALQRVAVRNPVINAFTAVTSERALAEAAAIDRRRANKETLPALAGVPYAVKNLYDIEGAVTLAGSIINRDNPPAAADALLVTRMRAAGAILLGATNMDEYAYGFTTENTHYGATRNPHDLQRSAGGSSGGSAAAVAAGCVPLSLGSDTNGSIRVPASFCGLYGLKPTYGRLPRSGAFLFCASLDHLGPFARSAVDLAACYDALQGPDAADIACSTRAAEPVMPDIAEGIAGLRIAVVDGYFEQNSHPGALAVRDIVARALGARKTVTIPEAGRARASAYIITATEAANLHFENLKSRAVDFEPLIRDRLLAGALTPATWILQAQRFRSWYRTRVLELFRDVDIILAAATPFPAPILGTDTGMVDGKSVPQRPNIGVLTQPISFIGLPVVAVPVWNAELPIGVQVIAAPWRESLALRVAAWLEKEGVTRSPIAKDMP
ncbi:MAG: AtzE family amidohydrolase [Betaproteobacteria bacterium]|nr:AtzE family amidohydrolase [Betaproteobacteria bacterium]